MYKRRRTEIKTESGWKRIKFKDLKCGDNFRLFNTKLLGFGSKPVEDDEGNNSWFAIGKPYRKNGILTVPAIEEKPTKKLIDKGD